MTKNHFTDVELMCPATKEVLLADGFLEILNELREKFDYPMKVNSCCRSRAYNMLVKGHKKSLHLMKNPYHHIDGTCAIDISTSDYSKTRRESLIALAAANGWSIGFGDNFLHLDRRVDYTNLPQTFFTYSDK